MLKMNITKQLSNALSVFEKVAKELEDVIEKATAQYQKAENELLEAEAVIKKANGSLGQIRRITEEVRK
jgi:methyl-accepting chemotaxis protein